MFQKEGICWKMMEKRVEILFFKEGHFWNFQNQQNLEY